MGSTGFRNPRALGCSIPSVARALLRGILPRDPRYRWRKKIVIPALQQRSHLRDWSYSVCQLQRWDKCCEAYTS